MNSVGLPRMTKKPTRTWFLPQSVTGFARRRVLPAIFPGARWERFRGPFDDVANEWSLIHAPHEFDAQASRPLIELALNATRRALDVDLDPISIRAKRATERSGLRTWPGEHYRLLVG